GGSDQRLGGEDSLLGLLDRNLSLLDVLDDVELSGFHGGPGAFEQSLRLLIPRDPTAAIEEGPVQRQTNCPGLVEVLLGAAVRTLTRDVRQKVAKGLSLSGLGGRGGELGAAVLGPLTERIGPELLAGGRHGPVHEV